MKKGIVLILLLITQQVQSQTESRIVADQYYDSLLHCEVKLILHDREHWGSGDNIFSLQIEKELFGRESMMAVGGSLSIQQIGEHLKGKYIPRCDVEDHLLHLMYKDDEGQMIFLHTFDLGRICIE